MAFHLTRPSLLSSCLIVLASVLGGCAADEFTMAPAADDAAPVQEDAGAPDTAPETAPADSGTPEPVDAGDASDADAAEADAPYAPVNHAVKVTSTGYDPVEVKIKKGDSVTWTWYDGPHTVTSGFLCKQDLLFDSGNLITTNTFTLTFHIASVFPYYSKEACNTFEGVVSVSP